MSGTLVPSQSDGIVTYLLCIPASRQPSRRLEMGVRVVVEEEESLQSALQLTMVAIVVPEVAEGSLDSRRWRIQKLTNLGVMAVQCCLVMT
jgi:hypothetical protein